MACSGRAPVVIFGTDISAALAAEAYRSARHFALMYIDDCQHTFEELARTVLPRHMLKLEQALRAPILMSDFAMSGIGPATIARKHGLAGDFSGCYALIDGEEAFYVGISRKVLSRLRQHVLGRTHFDASLAYLIAQKRCPTPGTRDAAMADPPFQSAFDDAKLFLRGLAVAFVPIPNPLELYVFEAYAAMSLRTHQWNTFRTH